MMLHRSKSMQVTYNTNHRSHSGDVTPATMSATLQARIAGGDGETGDCNDGDISRNRQRVEFRHQPSSTLLSSNHSRGNSSGRDGTLNLSAAVSLDDLLTLQDNLESSFLLESRVKRTSPLEPAMLSKDDDELLLPRTTTAATGSSVLSQDFSTTAIDRELLAQSSLDFQKLPYVGRAEELETLRRAVRQVCGGAVEVSSASRAGEGGPADNGGEVFLSQRRRRGLVLIHGESGIGKSKLAEQLRRQVQFPRVDTSRRITSRTISEDGELEHPPPINETIQGFVIFGKFDATPMNEPYAAIRHALGEICRQIQEGVAEDQDEAYATAARRRKKSSRRSHLASPTESEMARTQLRKELKRQKLDRTLVDAIPNLSSLVSIDDDPCGSESSPGHQEDFSNTDPSVLKDGDFYLAMFYRLKYAYRRFIQIVSRIAPIVLVLDDCQWADEDSLELIQSWLNDDGSDLYGPNSEGDGSILITLCYRDDKLTEDSILAKMLAETRTFQHVPVFDIPLDILDPSDVTTLLTALLDCNFRKAQTLGDTCYRKTNGNPFFLVQFLRLLWETEHLKFDLRTRNWMWNVNAIRNDYGDHSENIEDLMQQKMQRIALAQEILPIAACLGSTFQYYTLLIVMMGLNGKIRQQGSHGSIDDMIDKQTHCQVQQCIRHGFLEQANYGCYKFVHAHVQDAALAFLSEEELTKLRFSIGDILLESFTVDEMEDMIFLAVNLLNFQARSLAKSSSKRLQIASLNLDAGKQALNDFAAFKPASRFLDLAMELLPAGHWKNLQSMSMQIYSLSVCAAYCSADFDKVKRYYDEVSKISHIPILQKLPMYHTMMVTNAATNRIEDNLQFGLSILNDMGVKLPYGPASNKISTAVGMVFTKRKSKNLSWQLAAKIPSVSDSQNLGIMKTLYLYATAAMFGKPEVVLNVVHEMERRTAKFGLTAYSALGLSLEAWVYSVKLKDYATADACCSAAISLAKRCHAPGVESLCIAVRYSVGAPWISPLHQCLGPLFDGYSIGMQEGAVQPSFACIYSYLEMSLYNCQHLSTMEDDLRMFVRHMQYYKHGSRIHDKTSILLQAVRTLRGDESVMFENENFYSTYDDWIETCVIRCKMYVSCYMGQHEDVAENALIWYDKCIKCSPGEFSNVELVFVTGLSCFAMTKATGSKKYHTLAMKSAKQLKVLAALDNPNVVAYSALLDAETVSTRKHQAAKAVEHYENAIAEAQRMGRLQVQALANERFSLYLDEIGYIDDAKYRMTEALKLYAEWGAMAKVEQLELHSPLVDTPGKIESSVEIVFELDG